MGDLVIYNEDRQKLPEVAFIKSVSDHVKIRDISNSYELSKRLSLIFVVITNHLGIKDPIHDITKNDIRELILSRFKNLSIDEVAYAFKMERYGMYEEKTEHYQLFNAEYVSAVLNKYIKKKRDIKILHEISVKHEVVETSEEEKKYWINKGVLGCLNFFIENQFIENGRIYIYDVLYDEYLPKEKEYKDSIHKAAIECIEVEQNLRKAKSRDEVKDIKSVLQRIKNPKDGLIINKCKELVLCKFFRDLLKDEEKLKEFKNKFKIEENGKKI